MLQIMSIANIIFFQMEFVGFYNLMEKRSSSSSSYFMDRHPTFDSLFKKQSMDSQSWKILTINNPLISYVRQDRPEIHCLSTYFDKPDVLLNRGNLRYFKQTQRLAQGVYILMSGKIRILVANQKLNITKQQIELAIRKIDKDRVKVQNHRNKFIVEEVISPFKVVYSSNNCLAIGGSYAWQISKEELNRHKFYQKQRQIKQLMLKNSVFFTCNTNLLYAYSEYSFSFRQKIEFPQDVELAVIKHGSILVKWNQTNKKIIIGEGNTIIKDNRYQYQCQSFQVKIIAVIKNKTFIIHTQPLWVKSYIVSHSTTEVPSASKLLYRHKRFDNCKSSIFKHPLKQSTNLDDISNLQIGTASIEQGVKSLQKYQIVSNARSKKEIDRISKFRDKYKNIYSESSFLQSQLFLKKKVAKNSCKSGHEDKDKNSKPKMLLALNLFYKAEGLVYHQ